MIESIWILHLLSRGTPRKRRSTVSHSQLHPRHYLEKRLRQSLADGHSRAAVPDHKVFMSGSNARLEAGRLVWRMPGDDGLGAESCFKESDR